MLDAELKELLIQLDMALTEKDRKTAEHTARNKQMSTFDFIMGELYYLSDGGYSRVFYSDFSKKLCVSSESLDKVKSNWKECTVLRAKIEIFIMHFINDSTVLGDM